jgi:hypothetical protein
MPKPEPPVFHIPVGRRRRRNGKVVLFKDHADQAESMEGWVEMTWENPASRAAGACVIIGPTTTSYYDLQTKTVLNSRTAEGAWQPSALSDFLPRTEPAGGKRQKARRRKPWQGPLPDALFVRLPDHPPEITLYGYMHLLSPPVGDDEVINLVSEFADQLMQPERTPADGTARPLWLEPQQSWSYGLATVIEIKRKVLDSRVVNVVMVDRPNTCEFGYEFMPEPVARQMNRALSEGLLPLRSNAGF